ncbi:uncharacterized protein BX663DRAFT_487548 [Cokeromyces recurvatus]|uniref:uncharacterized protein n=1 Tax=Cokeromyces recurvatus TaxID=90255 RepID=UPI00221EECF7|nr:uncharacterized protein BX663DRAFT_487548 [Cokeromyces recurvatus]KAI7901387.1 hypothetical protein BX663DRAFT_487548 [Cokeromyces recurvatus]
MWKKKVSKNPLMRQEVNRDNLVESFPAWVKKWRGELFVVYLFASVSLLLASSSFEAHTSNVQASIHENPEDTENLTSISEPSSSQVKDMETSDNSSDAVNVSSGSSERIKLLTNSSFDIFDNCFKKMKEDKKWKLRSEKVVEDILYSYGSDLERENAIHSFIFDISDSKVKSLFTDDEWAEITSEGNKKDVALLEEIRSLLEGMNKVVEHQHFCLYKSG